MDVTTYWKEKGPLRLVLCDIDNTLVVKHHTLTRRAAAMIQQLREAGILFGIASGRSLKEVQRIITRWGFDDMDVLICLNGSVLWDGFTKTETDYHSLRREDIKEILELMTPFDHNPIIYRNDALYCGHIDEVVEISANSAEMKAIEVEHWEDFYQSKNAKIMFRVAEEDMESIEAYLKQHPSPAYHAFKTQSTLIEFSNRHVSKAYAMEKFCDAHALPLSGVMSFGDTSNDNSMLAASGFGVCMRNGSEDTQAIADIITEKDCDEDGWADFMEQHIMQGGKWL